MSNERTAALLDTLADCARDYALSRRAIQQLLRLTADLVRQDLAGPEEFGRRFMERVAEIRLDKVDPLHEAMKAATDAIPLQDLRAAVAERDLELVRAVRDLCADAIIGMTYDDDSYPGAEDDIRKLDPEDLLQRVHAIQREKENPRG